MKTLSVSTVLAIITMITVIVGFPSTGSALDTQEPPDALLEARNNLAKHQKNRDRLVAQFNSNSINPKELFIGINATQGTYEDSKYYYCFLLCQFLEHLQPLLRQDDKKQALQNDIEEVVRQRDDVISLTSIETKKTHLYTSPDVLKSFTNNEGEDRAKRIINDMLNPQKQKQEKLKEIYTNAKELSVALGTQEHPEELLAARDNFAKHQKNREELSAARNNFAKHQKNRDDLVAQFNSNSINPKELFIGINATQDTYEDSKYYYCFLLYQLLEHLQPFLWQDDKKQALQNDIEEVARQKDDVISLTSIETKKTHLYTSPDVLKSFTNNEGEDRAKRIINDMLKPQEREREQLNTIHTSAVKLAEELGVGRVVSAY